MRWQTKILAAIALAMVIIASSYLAADDSSISSSVPSPHAVASTTGIASRATGSAQFTRSVVPSSVRPSAKKRTLEANLSTASSTFSVPSGIDREIAHGLRDGYALAAAINHNAVNAQAHVDRLCSESRRLRAAPCLREPETHERDAAALMAPLIDYEKPLDQPPGLLHVPVVERVYDYGADWPTRITEQDLANLDFSWMTALSQFDHWTVLRAGRLREFRPENLLTDPIPNYRSLQAWSKLRLMAGILTGNFAEASIEVRHLADLVRTQGLLISEMIGVAIYRTDAKGRELAKQAGLDVSDVPAIDLGELERHRRVAHASVFFVFPGVGREVIQKASSCVLVPCVTFLEGIAANQSLGAWSSNDNLSLLIELAERHGCDPDLIDRALEGRELDSAEGLEWLAEELEHQIALDLD